MLSWDFLLENFLGVWKRQAETRQIAQQRICKLIKKTTTASAGGSLACKPGKMSALVKRGAMGLYMNIPLSRILFNVFFETSQMTDCSGAKIIRENLEQKAFTRNLDIWTSFQRHLKRGGSSWR